MKKIINDPFETASWSFHTFKTPEAVLSDIFSNDSLAYFKTSIQVAFRSVMLNIAVKEFQHKELFRTYLRVNSLILVGAYFYKKHKKRLRKEESAIDNTSWQLDKNAQENDFLQFYADPQYRIFCLFEMDTIPYWKAEWGYFVLAAFRKRKYNDIESYPPLNYFIHTLIDALYEIHQSN